MEIKLCLPKCFGFLEIIVEYFIVSNLQLILLSCICCLISMEELILIKI